MFKRWHSAASGLRSLVSISFAASSSAKSSYHTIQAIPRELSGNRISARDRAQGRIPAVVFTQVFHREEPQDGGKAVVTRSVSRKHLVTTEGKQIRTLMKTVEPEFFCSTTFKLQIRAGSGSSMLLESGNVLPIKVHRDEATGNILNLVFIWAAEGSELKVDVPIVFKGEDASPGIKKGGHLNRIRPTLKYLCPADQIPPKLEVDVSNMDIGDRVLINDVKVHPSLKLLSRNEVMPVCKIDAIEPSPATPAAV